MSGAPFNVGSIHATLTDLKISSTTFTPGDLLTLAATLQNTGNTPITGTLIIQVRHRESFSATAMFIHSFSSLALGQPLAFDAIWNTSSTPTGEYIISAYANYAASTSNEQIRIIVTNFPPVAEYKIYLPLVRR